MWDQRLGMQRSLSGLSEQQNDMACARRDVAYTWDRTRGTQQLTDGRVAIIEMMTGRIDLVLAKKLPRVQTNLE
jgi:hypothetical protein